MMLIEQAWKGVLGHARTVGVAALGCLLAASAQAGPLRYASLHWELNQNTGAVDFQVQTGWRISDFAGVTPSNASVPLDLGVSFNFGDGSSQALVSTSSLQILPSEGYFYAQSNFSHRYAPGAGLNFEAGFSGCCTLPNLQNSNAGQGYDISTRVNLTAGVTKSPKNSIPAMMVVPLGYGVDYFQVPAVAYDNDSLRFVLDPLGGVAEQPDFISLDSFGQARIDTTVPGLESGLYDLRFQIESVNPFSNQVNSYTSVYMLVNVPCTTGPSCSNPDADPPGLVPEPGSLPLALLALAGAATARRVRARA